MPNRNSEFAVITLDKRVFASNLSQPEGYFQLEADTSTYNFLIYDKRRTNAGLT